MYGPVPLAVFRTPPGRAFASVHFGATWHHREARHAREERRVRLRGVDIDGVRVHDIHAVNDGVGRAGVRVVLRVERAHDAVLDRIRVEGLAVVEGDVLPQRELHRVVVQPLPGGREERRDRLAVPLDLHQRLVDMAQDALRDRRDVGLRVDARASSVGPCPSRGQFARLVALRLAGRRVLDARLDLDAHGGDRAEGRRRAAGCLRCRAGVFAAAAGLPAAAGVLPLAAEAAGLVAAAAPVVAAVVAVGAVLEPPQAASTALAAAAADPIRNRRRLRIRE